MENHQKIKNSQYHIKKKVADCYKKLIPDKENITQTSRKKIAKGEK